MKAISLTQPWATLMAIDAKRYETRGPTFPRRHLGELAICASKAFPVEARRLTREDPFCSALVRAGYVQVGASSNPTADALPLGCVVAVVEVVGYATSDGAPNKLTFTEFFLHKSSPAPHEAAFGDYSPGRTIIITRNVRRLVEPVPVRGMLGIFSLPPDVEARVRKQVAP